MQGKYDARPTPVQVRCAREAVLDSIRARQDLRCIACGRIRARLEDEQAGMPRYCGVCVSTADAGRCSYRSETGCGRCVVDSTCNPLASGHPTRRLSFSS